MTVAAVFVNDGSVNILQDIYSQAVTGPWSGSGFFCSTFGHLVGGDGDFR